MDEAKLKTKTTLYSLLERMLRHKCWHVGAGGCTGSMFMLYLGDKINRDKPLSSLSPDSPIKMHVGEFYIFVQDGHWELLLGANRIAYDESDSSLGGELVIGLEKLNNQCLEGFWLDGHSNLVLYFESDLLLRLFTLRKSLDIKSRIPIYSVGGVDFSDISVL